MKYTMEPLHHKTKMSDIERLKHIFHFINFDGLTEAQENLVISFEEQFLDHDRLSDRQVEILESIYKQAATKGKRW